MPLASWFDALRAGYSTFRTVLQNPEDTTSKSAATLRRQRYALLWHYYTNEIFEDFEVWREYVSEFRLYRNIRSIYNPVTRIVDFYAGVIYPGRLSVDGTNLPDGIPNAIPFPESVDTPLREAIGQFWQWSNWLQNSKLMIRYAATTGNALVTIVDDLDRQKVAAKVVWPGLVSDLELDDYGNLEMYELRYMALDEESENDQPYEYCERVSKESIETFRDDQPFSYNGVPESRANPYSFVPAVWVKHNDLGTEFGAPALRASVGKIDELNSIGSHLHDHLHKMVENPWIMWTNGEILPAFSRDVTMPSSEEESPTEMAEDLMFLKGPAGGSIDTLVGSLQPAEAMLYMDKLIGEIEHDYPELALYNELRSMQQVTGPGGSWLVGDVDAKKEEAGANYDGASISLFRMALAIAGERLRRGDWKAPTKQQEKFKGYDLSTYEAGGFDGLAILPRPLIPVTAQSSVELQTKRAGYANAIREFVSADEYLRVLGYDEKRIKKIKAEIGAENSDPPPEQ